MGRKDREGAREQVPQLDGAGESLAIPHQVHPNHDRAKCRAHVRPARGAASEADCTCVINLIGGLLQVELAGATATTLWLASETRRTRRNR